MTLFDRSCTKSKYLCAIKKLEQVLDEDEYAKRGDEKDKTRGVVLS
jgi:hypothetical protein